MVETRIPSALAVGNAKLNPTTILPLFKFPQNQGEIYDEIGGVKNLMANMFVVNL